MKRKRAWGPSNPLWRYLHGKKSRSKRAKVKTMARRHRYRRSSRGSRGLFGLSTKSPILPSMGLLGLGLAFLGGEYVGSMVPVVNQQQPLVRNAAGGFLLAGPAGALIQAGKTLFMGGSSGSSGGYSTY